MLHWAQPIVAGSLSQTWHLLSLIVDGGLLDHRRPERAQVKNADLCSKTPVN